MKKAFIYCLAISLALTSCTSNESEESIKKENLLKSYSIQKGEDGVYSIQFNTTNNAEVTKVKNIDNSKDFLLTESNQKSKTKYSNDFSIENDELKIGFLDFNQNKTTKIFVEDDNITLANKGVTEFLSSYSVAKNSDGTYQLDFSVNDNVSVDFLYNEEIETYEVHLANGTSVGKDFSRALTMSQNVLRLDFVNHKYASKSGVETKPRKPRTIIVDIVGSIH